MNKFLSFLSIAILLVSCSPYQKALKSDDVELKAQVANRMYERNKFDKALDRKSVV